MRKKWVLVIGIISGIIVGVIETAIALFVLYLLFWPDDSSYDLGNNIYMMEWDGGGRLIVLCSHVEGKKCYGGSYLIPTYENSVDSNGEFAEYVVTAKSDEKWVIVKTDNFQSKQHKYYIINKDYDPNEMTTEEIINTKIDCFTDSSEFANKCLENGISIKW